jgi:hypothetical protein
MWEGSALRLGDFKRNPVSYCRILVTEVVRRQRIELAI